MIDPRHSLSLYEILTPNAHRLISLIDDDHSKNIILDILKQEKQWKQVSIEEVNLILTHLGLDANYSNWASLFLN